MSWDYCVINGIIDEGINSLVGYDCIEFCVNLLKVWCDLGYDGCREGDEVIGGEVEDDDEDDDFGGVFDWDLDG